LLRKCRNQTGERACKSCFHGKLIAKRFKAITHGARLVSQAVWAHHRRAAVAAPGALCFIGCSITAAPQQRDRPDLARLPLVSHLRRAVTSPNMLCQAANVEDELGAEQHVDRRVRSSMRRGELVLKTNRCWPSEDSECSHLYELMQRQILNRGPKPISLVPPSDPGCSIRLNQFGRRPVWPRTNGGVALIVLIKPAEVCSSEYSVDGPFIAEEAQNAFDEVQQVKIGDWKTCPAVKPAHDSAVEQSRYSAQPRVIDATNELERFLLAE